MIDKPTREHGNSSTLIDHIYTNTPQSLNVCVSCILKASLADHYSIVCITNYTTHANKTGTACKRDFSKKNMSKLKKKLKTQSWTHLYKIPEANSALTYFQRQFIYMFEECFPEVSYNIKYENRLPFIQRSS